MIQLQKDNRKYYKIAEDWQKVLHNYRSVTEGITQLQNNYRRYYTIQKYSRIYYVQIKKYGHTYNLAVPIIEEFQVLNYSRLSSDCLSNYRLPKRCWLFPPSSVIILYILLYFTRQFHPSGTWSVQLNRHPCVYNYIYTLYDV